MPQLFYAGNAVRRKRLGRLLRVIRREAKNLGSPAKHSPEPEVSLAAASDPQRSNTSGSSPFGKD
jgi:hypothetical protein